MWRAPRPLFPLIGGQEGYPSSVSAPLYPYLPADSLAMAGPAVRPGAPASQSAVDLAVLQIGRFGQIRIQWLVRLAGIEPAAFRSGAESRQSHGVPPRRACSRSEYCEDPDRWLLPQG
jgi:hypothetical protein